jgi:hypothetical protein
MNAGVAVTTAGGTVTGDSGPTLLLIETAQAFAINNTGTLSGIDMQAVAQAVADAGDLTVSWCL